MGLMNSNDKTKSISFLEAQSKLTPNSLNVVKICGFELHLTA